MTTPDLARLIEQHPVPVAATAVSALALLLLVLVVIRRAFRVASRLRARVGDEQLLTVATSTIATGVAAQGMWSRFEALSIPVWLRVLFFAFLELMVVTSALRARASMRAGHGTGVDGVAMWVLTCLSAVLSASHAAGPGELLLRLSAPLVAAWGWERSMSLERRARTGRTGMNWRLSPERLFVRLGLADPTDRTASEVDAQRRLMRLALAVQHARTTRPGWWDWRRKRAAKRLNRAMEGAVEYGGLGTDPDSRDTLLSVLGALVNASDLLELQTPAPWHQQAPIPDTSGALSGPSENPAIEAPICTSAGVNLRHPERGVSEVSDAGQQVHNLDHAIRAAKADGMSVREIVAAFHPVKKWRVEEALKSDSRSDTSDTALEASGIPPVDTDRSAGSSSVEAPDADSGRHFSDGGLRFAVKLRHEVDSHVEDIVRHTDNGQAPAAAIGEPS